MQNNRETKGPKDYQFMLRLKQPAGEFVNLMDFSNMTNGMYMLNVTAGGQKVTRKVTVSK